MRDENKAGSNIDSYCGKCRLTLDHTIMVMVGEVVSKVRCKSCGGTHQYRDPLTAQKSRTRKAKSGNTEAETAEIVWAAGLADAKGKICDYNMALKFRIGDVVNHQTFGKGVVTKLYANKCDMLFKDKERLMASANS